MKTLLLLRHAKAGAGAPDRERRLTERGRRQAAAAGRYLAREGLRPELALCSDAARARETLEGLELAADVPVRIEPDIYDGGEGDLLALFRRAPPEVASLLAVGHNPTISEVGSLLAAEGDAALCNRLALGMPTAGLAVLKFPIPDWAALAPGALTRLLAPADYSPQP